MTREQYKEFISNSYPVSLFADMHVKEDVAYECNDGIISNIRFDKEIDTETDLRG